MLDQEQYKNRLAQKFNKLGEGLYSHVFAVNNDKAIKVGRRDAWPSYIKWATENGHAGGFAPKVYSLKFYDDYYVAVMERLVDTIQAFRKNGGKRTEQVKAYAEGTAPMWRKPEIENVKADHFRDYIRKLWDARLAGDLHDKNVMVRQDGSLVVTDPISDYYSGDKFRIKNSELR